MVAVNVGATLLFAEHNGSVDRRIRLTPGVEDSGSAKPDHLLQESKQCAHGFAVDGLDVVWSSFAWRVRFAATSRKAPLTTSLKCLASSSDIHAKWARCFA